jgi:small subunit ribosomal protein S18
MARPRTTKNKDNARRSKKRTSILAQEKVTYVDYKDVNLLRRFQSDRAKIRARRVTGNTSQQQSEIANAIKNAREMALLPYSNRVTQQRGGGRGRDGDRRGRDDDRRDDRDDHGRDDEVTDVDAFAPADFDAGEADERADDVETTEDDE